MNAENTFDLVVIGGGIAGLASAINAASEGLSVCVLEGGIEFGGQTSTIKQIRNLVGYPEGISGRELIRLTLAQARGFGVKLCAPYRVQKIRRGSLSELYVDTSHGKSFTTRAILITAGVRYRRLGVDEVSSFMGHGVTYGELPDNIVGERVAVIGGGNSAGQAVVALAQKSECNIDLLVRGALSDKQMSQYLIDVIRKNAHGNIDVHEQVEVIGADGFLKLEHITLRSLKTQHLTRMPLDRLLISIGSEPHIEWAADQVVVDEKGFIKTGSRVASESVWINTQRKPLPFETTPGIFAAGDIESESVKRVASSIGAATGAIASILRFLGRR
ncbi:MAG: NAD(P)/FAD-dependent oxidoreductase [Candidatus Uhrbacteria bacterium]|nr:NAD(P)/FAD-dependent oxidoreductase [Candidatus Uhrbacteria bacterium]